MKITLKAARVNVGMSQKEAAKRLGISKDTLYNYECGRTFPDVPIINKMQNLYNIGYNDIIFLANNNDLIVVTDAGN